MSKLSDIKQYAAKITGTASAIFKIKSNSCFLMVLLFIALYNHIYILPPAKADMTTHVYKDKFSCFVYKMYIQKQIFLSRQENSSFSIPPKNIILIFCFLVITMYFLFEVKSGSLKD